MSTQDQFLNVIDRDEAEARFRAALNLAPLGDEAVPLSESLGRVLAADVLARVDVPSFDRSNFDGFAVHASDTFGASELVPRSVRLLPGTIHAGSKMQLEIGPGEAVAIATGGMVPRGADAIAIVEHTEVRSAAPTASLRDAVAELMIRKAVTPGFGISFAGSDIATGETVLRNGTLLTSRETGVLAAIGEARVIVWRRPRVAIISTGNELIAPGEPMRPPHVYDSNARILADSVRELGGQPRMWGIVHDDADALRQTLWATLAESDAVLLSGGTSKGQGDLCYRVVAELSDPGIVAHGVALKPGKPICLAASGGKPVVILPGFPTSAIFTFYEFVAPVILALGGRAVQNRPGGPSDQDRPRWPGYIAGPSWSGDRLIPARMAVKVNSEIGRTEYLLVNLVHSSATSGGALDAELIAYPMGKGSGSVTSFSRADGFVTIGRHTEIVDAGQVVAVRPIGQGVRVADLVAIGSHCVGLDYLLSRLQERGVTSKLIMVGSTAGLDAARRGECDLAGVHLFDPGTGVYNRPFMSKGLVLVEGYGRSQGIVYRRGDWRFEGRAIDEIAAFVAGDRSAESGGRRSAASAMPPTLAADEEASCVMVNRNQGSGTRVLIDRLLAGARPRGYAVQATNHNAVAAAVAQGRADWGMAIDTVAGRYDLGFVPYQDEQYDFVIPESRRDRPAVRAFIALLAEPATRDHLARLGFRLPAS